MSSTPGLAQPLPERVYGPHWSPGARLAPKGGIHPALLTQFSFQMSMLVMSPRNDDSKPLQNNYRPVQDLHGRRVLASFQTTLTSAKQMPSGKESVSVLRLHPSAGI